MVAPALSARRARRLPSSSLQPAADRAAAAPAAFRCASPSQTRRPKTAPRPGPGGEDPESIGSDGPRESVRFAGLDLGQAPLLRLARGLGGCGGGARHVSEPAAALLRPAAERRVRPAPPAHPRAAPPVASAGGRPPARVPPAPGGGLSGLGRREVVFPNR